MYMCVWCVWVYRRLGVRGGVAYGMPVIAFNGSTRTHTHVPFLYLPRLICPSTVYLSVSVFCVCTQHSPLFFSNTLSISFSWHSQNPLPFEEKSITAVVFWCWLSSLLCLRSEFTYVCGNDNTPTQQTNTQHTHSHTQQTRTQRCAHKWMNWRAAWWPVTINEPLKSNKKKGDSAIYDDNNEQQSILSKRTLHTATLYVWKTKESYWKFSSF